MRISDWSSDVCSSDLMVVVVARDLAREHVLAGVAIVSVADEPLFVARIDRGYAAQGEHHRVGEFDALQHLTVAGIGDRLAHRGGEAARGVVSGEGRDRKSDV